MFMYSILLSLKTSIAIGTFIAKASRSFCVPQNRFSTADCTHDDQADGALVRAVLANGCERCHFRHISDALIDCNFCTVIADVVP